MCTQRTDCDNHSCRLDTERREDAKGCGTPESSQSRQMETVSGQVWRTVRQGGCREFLMQSFEIKPIFEGMLYCVRENPELQQELGR